MTKMAAANPLFVIYGCIVMFHTVLRVSDVASSPTPIGHVTDNEDDESKESTSLEEQLKRQSGENKSIEPASPFDVEWNQNPEDDDGDNDYDGGDVYQWDDAIGQKRGLQANDRLNQPITADHADRSNAYPHNMEPNGGKGNENGLKEDESNKEVEKMENDGEDEEEKDENGEKAEGNLLQMSDQDEKDGSVGINKL